MRETSSPLVLYFPHSFCFSQCILYSKVPSEIGKMGFKGQAVIDKAVVQTLLWGEFHFLEAEDQEG